jgi:hypothetical protein
VGHIVPPVFCPKSSDFIESEGLRCCKSEKRVRKLLKGKDAKNTQRAKSPQAAENKGETGNAQWPKENSSTRVRHPGCFCVNAVDKGVRERFGAKAVDKGLRA